MGLPHRVLLCATLAVAQNMGQWVGGEHCAGSHCGPGKEEKRCEHPAGAGAHVLYNASVAVKWIKKEHLTTRWVHAVVDGCWRTGQRRRRLCRRLHFRASAWPTHRFFEWSAANP